MSPIKSEQIMDRFIPSNTSYKNYHSLQSDYQFDSNRSKRLKTIDGQGDVRDDSILNLSQSFIHEGSTALNSTTTSMDQYNNLNLDDLEGNVHRGAIADALNFNTVGLGGLNGKNRVFKFSPTKSSKTMSNNIDSSSSINSNSSYSYQIYSNIDEPIFSSSPIGINTSFSDLDSFNSIHHGVQRSVGYNSPKSTKKPIKSHIPFRVLDAPHLKNDFYANLISWSKTTNRIAVGLECNVYIWSEEEGAFALNIPEPEIILCVSFSDIGEYILVSTKEGRILLYSHESLVLIDEFFIVGRGINCITWFPNSTKRFVVGDLAGDVHIFEIDNEGCLRLLKQFKCNQQQVCGKVIP